MEIPIASTSVDQLPAELPLKYDDICNIVGHLYLDSYHRISVLEDQFKSIIKTYVEQNQQLQQDNEILKKQLENG